MQQKQSIPIKNVEPLSCKNFISESCYNNQKPDRRLWDEFAMMNEYLHEQ
jgi:hypothetical protein